MIRKNGTRLFFLAVVFLAGTASAETIELVTYYPASATTGDMHVTSLAVGSSYAGVTPADGQAFIYNRVGIGPGFTAAAPPTEVLEVVGNILANGPAGSDALFIADRPAANRLSGLQLQTNGALKWTIGSPADGTEDLQVKGTADAVSNAVFMPGADTAAAGTPEIRVGIGTATPAGPLHVVGLNDAISKVLFMPGADTVAAGTPEIRVGIGTNNPQEMAHVTGNLRVDGQLIVGQGINAEKGVFIDKLFVGSVTPDFNYTGTSFTDVPASVKTINLPAGIAVINYSLSAFPAAGVANGAAGAWLIKVVIGANESPFQAWFENTPGQHNDLSGSWVTNVAGGNTTIKLRVLNIGSGYPQSFYQNGGDYVTWTLVVYKS